MAVSALVLPAFSHVVGCSISVYLSELVLNRIFSNKVHGIATSGCNDSEIVGSNTANTIQKTTQNLIINTVQTQDSFHSPPDSNLISDDLNSDLLVLDSRLNYQSTDGTSNTLGCRFCGSSYHSRNLCPAKHNVCVNCSRRGHFFQVCEKAGITSHVCTSNVPMVAGTLSRTTVKILVNGLSCTALIDTGSTETYIDSRIARKLDLTLQPEFKSVKLASTSSVRTDGAACVDIKINNQCFNNVKISVLPDLCCDVIVGHDFLSNYSKLTVQFPYSTVSCTRSRE